MDDPDVPSRAELPSSGQLIRSTLVALVIALVLLVAVILPAEYGVDPTGVGGILGLAEMGEIKQQLAREAATDHQTSGSAAPEVGAVAVVARDPLGEAVPESGSVAASADGGLSGTDGPASGTAEWREEFTLTLAPSEGDDIKLVMSPGERVAYEWSVDRGHLNSDLHTDNGPGGGSHSYRQGRAETGVADEFTAVSEGPHGWFWRNRSNEVVTVTVRVRGDYREVLR